MSMMLDEIKEVSSSIVDSVTSAKNSIESAFDAILRSDYVIITGSGTSYNAGISLQISLMRKQIPAIAVRASDFRNYVPEKLSKKVTIVILSQSGESADALTALKLAHESGRSVIGITNEVESGLAHDSDIPIVTAAGHERAIAATKSYISQLTAISLIQGKLSNFNSVDHLKNVASWAEKTAAAHMEFQEIVHELHNKIVFLGDGYLFGTASEAALKFKETGNLMTEYYNVREYLHGPIQTLDESTTVMFFNSKYNNSKGVLDIVKKYTKSIITVGSHDDDSISVPDIIEELEPLVHIIPIQILAYYKALSLGLDPDKPEKLNKVVK